MAIAEPPTKTPTAGVVLMTPALAARLLAANENNRHIRPTVVHRYARDMLHGDWSLNGETIKIAASGRVIDGQHRLSAVVEAGIDVLMFVVEGLPEDSQDTVDRGLGRNIADALRLRGEVDVNNLGAGIAQAIVLRSDTPTQSSHAWPSTREALHYLDEHPGIRASLAVGGRVRRAISYPSSTATALHHLMAELDQDDADVFWESLASGVELAEDSPILRLRELTLRDVGAVRKMARSRRQALTIKAWNAWRRGESMQLLRWSVGGSKPEPFPRPE